MKDIAAIRERHVERKTWPLMKTETNVEPDGYKHWCKFDGQRWPCDAAQLLVLLADTPSAEPAGVERHPLTGAPMCCCLGGKEPCDHHDRSLPTQASDSSETTT